MRKRIAVIFGGHSSEYEVSLQSAFSVLQNMNENKFEVFPVGITREGEWYHYTGGLEQIRDNSWAEEKENLHSVAVSQSRPAQAVDYRGYQGADYLHPNYRAHHGFQHPLHHRPKQIRQFAQNLLL